MLERKLSVDLVRVLKQLKLGKLLPTLAERLRQARERVMDPEDVLLLVLSDEVQRRQRQRLANRTKRAGLNADLVFDAWDTSAKVAYDRHLLDELRTLRFVEEHHHVLVMGPVGVGKTMLAHALGHLAVQRELSVHCETADKLFRRLKASRLDDTHAQELRRLVAVDLLVIDDFALRALDGMETADLYELVTARHRRGSMIVTTYMLRCSACSRKYHHAPPSNCSLRRAARPCQVGARPSGTSTRRGICTCAGRRRPSLNSSSCSRRTRPLQLGSGADFRPGRRNASSRCSGES